MLKIEDLRRDPVSKTSNSPRTISLEEQTTLLAGAWLNDEAGLMRKIDKW